MLHKTISSEGPVCSFYDFCVEPIQGRTFRPRLAEVSLQVGVVAWRTPRLAVWKAGFLLQFRNSDTADSKRERPWTSVGREVGGKGFLDIYPESHPSDAFHLGIFSLQQQNYTLSFSLCSVHPQIILMSSSSHFYYFNYVGFVNL